MSDEAIQKLKYLYYELSSCTGGYMAYNQPIADRIKEILESEGYFV
jgi:hypothetical protein